MAIARSTMIGVFDSEASAENAIDALHNAGFSDDQLRYSGHVQARGGFLEGIKSLFTGGATGSHSERVVNDLMDLGLPQEEASYYAVQHQNGHPIVAVKANDRMQEATQILQNNGGSSYRAGVSTSVASTYGQSTAFSQDTNPADQYDQPPRTPADQYNQQAYSQGSQYDPNAETEEHRQARLRAERQQNQFQAQSQPGVAPTRDTYTDDDRNAR